MINITIFLTAVILVSLIFALTNGLNDASSVVATFITSGGAAPLQAILLASFFSLLGALLGGSAVANTISKLMDIPAGPPLLKILLAAILGAVLWNFTTWKLGLPSSSTHSLVGGIIGAVWISSGRSHINWGINELLYGSHHLTGIVKIIAALIFSPFLGFIIAFIIQKITKLLFKNAKFTLNKKINRTQWLMSAALAYSHGANDTQKIVGIITLALFASGKLTVNAAPFSIKAAAGIIMFCGTMLGGWPIMKTIGRRIYTIRPIHSINSETASGISLLMATLLGAPVSTTHVVVGSVMGVGAADEYKMVHWNIAKGIISAWVITIPLSACAASLIYFIISLVTKFC